jgi:hypothetical protein
MCKEKNIALFCNWSSLHLSNENTGRHHVCKSEGIRITTAPANMITQAIENPPYPPNGLGYEHWATLERG